MYNNIEVKQLLSFLPFFHGTKNQSLFDWLASKACKVDGSQVALFLIRTPMFDWCVGR